MLWSGTPCGECFLGLRKNKKKAIFLSMKLLLLKNWWPRGIFNYDSCIILVPMAYF